MKLSVTRTHTPGARLRALVVGLLVALAPGLASAQTVAATAGQADTPSKVMRVDLGGQAMGASQNLSIPRGKSAIVELPVDARDVLVSDPRVADAVLRSPRRIYIMGMAGGQTDAAFFDAQGRRILGLNIRVDLDYSAVSQTINRLIPGARVQVDGINNSLVLSGLVNSAPDAANAVQIAQQFTDKPTQIVNMIGIAGKEQVMLKVRIVEVQRSVIKQLGFNMSTVVGQLGSPQFIASNAATWGVNGALLGGLSGAGYALDTTSQPEATIAGASDTSLNGLPIVCHGGCTNGGDGTIATIKNTAGSTGLNKASSTISAFEQVGLVRTLAEPNLTALSGESAKFLAGGEFPVPAGLSQNGQVRSQTLRRRPRLHAGGALRWAHLAQGLDRGVGTDQPGIVQHLDRRRRRQRRGHGPNHSRPECASGRDHHRTAVRRRDDDRRSSEGRDQAGYRLAARHDDPAGARRALPLA